MEKQGTPQYVPLTDEFCDSIGPADQFIVSYQRSGSRWLRLAIADIANQLFGKDPHAIYQRQLAVEQWRTREKQDSIGPTDVVPVAGFPVRDTSLWTALGTGPIYRSHNLEQIVRRSASRIVYMFRSPAAAFLSHYYFLQAQDRASATTTIDEFCLKRIDSWVDHVSCALQCQRTTRARILMIAYGQPLPIDGGQLAAVLSFLGIGHTSAMIGQAVARLDCFFRQLNQTRGAVHQRGSSDDLLCHLKRFTVALIERRTQAIYERAAFVSAAQLAERVWEMRASRA